MARELTKVHEEIRGESLSGLLVWLADRGTVKGELVVAVTGAREERAVDGGDLRELLISCRGNGLTLRDAVKRAAGELGPSRSAVYQEALALWKK